MQGITVKDAPSGLVVARIMTGSAVEKQGDTYNTYLTHKHTMLE